MNLNKRKISKSFDYVADTPITQPASLNIENGNDISFVVKLGKTFFDKITPYVLCGFYNRKSSFEFKYLPVDIGVAGWEEAFLASGSNKSKYITRFLFGAGVSVFLDSKTEVRLEYCCKNLGTVNCSTVVDTTCVDAPGYPRYFKLKNKQHSISIGVSRNISFGD